MSDDNTLQVLLVEDSAFQRGMIADSLQGSIFTRQEAGSLEEAVEFLEENSVDVILLDLCLPGSDGLPTLEAVTKVALGTPIVVLTGHDKVETGVQAVQAGAYGYLTKTKINSDQLIESLKSAVRRASEMEEDIVRKKLEGVIEMAGAIAHEINQPLQTCLDYLELIQISLKDDPEVSRRLATAIDELHRVTKITERLTHVKRYRTRTYLDSNIIDLENASS